MKTRWKYAVYAALSFGAIVCVSAIVFVSYTDFFINTFLKDRIANAFQEAYPAYAIRIGDMHYSIRENRIGFDSVALTARDSTLSCTVASYSASGIGWLELLWARGLVPHGFTGTVLDARGIVVSFPKEQYALRFGVLHVSVPDSVAIVDSATFHPLGDDEQFFAGSKFRRTRIRLEVSHARFMGLACLELMQGKGYRTRSAQVHDPFLDVLINKEKKFARSTSSPLMPSEVLASIKEILRVDSLSFINGRLLYGERFAVGAKPALITIDSIQVLAEGIANHGDSGAALIIRAQGKFMKAGAMTLFMSIPIASQEFSYKYSGSLSRMDLTLLNSFLEPAEHIRVKYGTIQRATFAINVASGRATGNVRAIYRDLSLKAINKQTGSDMGFFDGIASFIANTFKIRGTNVPDKSGSIKIGKVEYTRKPDEFFLEFSWFALRSGLKDVVGF